jgi:anti-anti-sigma factor
MLIRVHKRCKDFKIEMKLCNIDKEIEKVFKITGLNKILAIFPDTASATAAFKKKGFFGR